MGRETRGTARRWGRETRPPRCQGVTNRYPVYCMLPNCSATHYRPVAPLGNCPVSTCTGHFPAREGKYITWPVLAPAAALWGFSAGLAASCRQITLSSVDRNGIRPYTIAYDSTGPGGFHDTTTREATPSHSDLLAGMSRTHAIKPAPETPFFFNGGPLPPFVKIMLRVGKSYPRQ